MLSSGWTIFQGRAVHPNLGPGKGYGRDDPECHCMSLAGQPGKWSSCWASLIRLLWQSDLLSRWRKSCGCNLIYLDFIKVFLTIFHSILLEKLSARGLDGFILQWVKTGWMAGPRELMVNGANPVVSWSLTVFPKAQFWGQSCSASLLMIWTWGLRVASVNLQMAPRCAGVLVCWRLCRETWTDLVRGVRMLQDVQLQPQCQILHWNCSDPLQNHRLGHKRLESWSSERDLGCLLKLAEYELVCARPLYSAVVRLHLELGSGPLSLKRTWMCWSTPSDGQQGSWKV